MQEVVGSIEIADGKDIRTGLFRYCDTWKESNSFNEFQDLWKVNLDKRLIRSDGKQITG